MSNLFAKKRNVVFVAIFYTFLPVARINKAQNKLTQEYQKLDNRHGKPIIKLTSIEGKCKIKIGRQISEGGDGYPINVKQLLPLAQQKKSQALNYHR